jgi:hypothetical protein
VLFTNPPCADESNNDTLFCPLPAIANAALVCLHRNKLQTPFQSVSSWQLRAARGAVSGKHVARQGGTDACRWNTLWLTKIASIRRKKASERGHRLGCLY